MQDIKDNSNFHDEFIQTEIKKLNNLILFYNGQLKSSIKKLEAEQQKYNTEINTAIENLQTLIQNPNTFNIFNTDKVAIGTDAGKVDQGTNAIAIGINAAKTNQGSDAIAVGNTAAQTSQPANSICIGGSSKTLTANSIYIGHNGTNLVSDSSIVLNAAGLEITPATGAFYVKPVRATDISGYRFLYYNTTTGEIAYQSTN